MKNWILLIVVLMVVTLGYPREVHVSASSAYIGGITGSLLYSGPVIQGECLIPLKEMTALVWISYSPPSWGSDSGDEIDYLIQVPKTGRSYRAGAVYFDFKPDSEQSDVIGTFVEVKIGRFKVYLERDRFIDAPIEGWCSKISYSIRKVELSVGARKFNSEAEVPRWARITLHFGNKAEISLQRGPQGSNSNVGWICWVSYQVK
jgi:hypothetical protein